MFVQKTLNKFILNIVKAVLLTLDELFTHLPCDGTDSSLGLQVTLKKQTKGSQSCKDF